MNLAKELLERGYEVIVASRRGSLRKRGFIAEELRRLGARIEVAESITSSMLRDLGGDVYYHLAGRISGRWVHQWSAHVGLLSTTIDAASELGARVVYVSAVLAVGGVRGAGRGSLIVEEEDHLAGEREYKTVYEKTKAEGERLLVRRGGELGGKWCIVRPGTVIGPWAYHREWGLLVGLARRGIGVSLSTTIPLVYSVDLARVLADAGEGALDGKWVNAVGYNEDIFEVYRIACERFRVKCRRVGVGRLLGLLGSLAPKSSSLAVVARGLELGYRYSSRILDYEWSPLEEAVGGFIEWASTYTL